MFRVEVNGGLRVRIAKGQGQKIILQQISMKAASRVSSEQGIACLRNNGIIKDGLNVACRSEP